MRQTWQFITCKITGITNSEITYKAVHGNNKWTYKIHDGQVINLDKLSVGSYYYIISEDIGKQGQCYIWTSATKLNSKTTAIALYNAHLSRKKVTGSLYHPLPEYLLKGILELGEDAFKVWCITKGENGDEEPSASTFNTALLIHKSKTKRRSKNMTDQNMTELLKIIEKMQQQINELSKSSSVQKGTKKLPNPVIYSRAIDLFIQKNGLLTSLSKSKTNELIKIAKDLGWSGKPITLTSAYHHRRYWLEMEQVNWEN